MEEAQRPAGSVVDVAGGVWRRRSAPAAGLARAPSAGCGRAGI